MNLSNYQNELNVFLDDELSSLVPVFVIVLLALFQPFFSICHHYSIQVISGSCRDHVRVMSESCQGHARIMPGSCYGHARSMAVSWQAIFLSFVHSVNSTHRLEAEKHFQSCSFSNWLFAQYALIFYSKMVSIASSCCWRSRKWNCGSMKHNPCM